jgi:lipopolysaccharide export system protein LptA
LKQLLLILFIIHSVCVQAQTKKINILNADNTFAEPEYPGATVYLGNIFIEHDGATLKCDKAYVYQESKLIKAMGRVVLNQGDTIIQRSKYVDYNGNTKRSKSWGKVILTDPTMTLRTDTLHFNRITQHLYYNSGGTIKDSINVLKSKEGNYYLNVKKFQGFNKVEVTNEDSKLETNHLDYYTETGIADVFGPSNITSESNRIYTEKGHYNSKTGISHFLEQSKIFYGDRTIQGDSLYYDENLEFASATKNITVTDSINSSIAKGDYAEYYKLKDSVFITENAVAITVKENDSTFIHGDILLTTGKVDERVFKAYNHVKLFKSDLQAKCDSLVSYEETGLTKMFVDPVLWAEENQITGDIIHLLSNAATEELDSIKILGNAFMTQKDSAGFSQLKGKNMYGKFLNNELSELDVVSNSELMFFIRDEDDVLVGIKMMQTSRNIFITLINNDISTIDYNDQPDGRTYPPSDYEELSENEKLFNGFIWREHERPLSKYDIFKIDDLNPEIKPKRERRKRE